jgi:hypothetical protein
LETPIDNPGDDKRNVAALWRLTGRVVRATGNGMKPRRRVRIGAKTRIRTKAKAKTEARSKA